MDEDAVIAGSSTKSGEGATAQSRVQKIGWGVLLAISGLLVLNGIMWFGSGAGLTLAYPQRPHCEGARNQSEDRAESRFERAGQATGRRPSGGHYPCQRRGPGGCEARVADREMLPHRLAIRTAN